MMFALIRLKESNETVQLIEESQILQLNSLSNDKILDWSKLKEFADAKIKVTQILKIGFGRKENIAETGENASYQYFLLSPQCFQTTKSLTGPNSKHLQTTI